MARDIAADTLAVGNALTSVRIDQLILNLAKGIAWGQYDLDKVGVDITKMMGVPGTVSIGGEKLSMLEAGFLPSFYHFVDTILELKMEVHIREEINTSFGYKDEVKASTTVDAGVELSTSASANVGIASVEGGVKAHWNTISTAGYSRTIDAAHSQKFSQDLAASSSIRTKIVPVPPPELLVERIKILLERLRKESEDEDRAQILFSISGVSGTLPEIAAFSNELGKSDIQAKLGHVGNEPLAVEVTTLQGTGPWTFRATFGQASSETSFLVLFSKSAYDVYQGETKKSLDEILMKKIEDRLLERVQGK